MKFFHIYIYCLLRLPSRLWLAKSKWAMMWWCKTSTSPCMPTPWRKAIGWQGCFRPHTLSPTTLQPTPHCWPTTALCASVWHLTDTTMNFRSTPTIMPWWAPTPLSLLLRWTSAPKWKATLKPRNGIWKWICGNGGETRRRRFLRHAHRRHYI